MEPTNISTRTSDEVSLKELILKCLEWLRYLKTKWIVIILFGFLGATIGYMYAFVQTTTYTAELTFALEEDKSAGSGLSSALGIASSFGIDLGGGGAGGAFSGANLLELMKSRTLVEKALLQPISVKGKTESLADYYMGFTQFNKGWSDNPLLKNIQFNPLEDRDKFTLQKDSILGILYQQISGGLLTVSQKDKKISIITIEVKSSDELFSKYFTETIAKVVSDFYIDTKSKKAKLNYEVLQKQTDSIRNELNTALTGVAVANDNTYNLNPALNVHRVPTAKRQVDVQANTAILTQLVANLEMAKVSLRKETPLIQIIDSPILPLKKNKHSKLKSLILGGFMFAMFAIFFLLISKLLKQIML